MKLKTIVVDDEPLAAMLLEGYVTKTPFLELVGSFSTAVEAASSEELETADLLLLDIQMPTLSGLEFSRMVKPATRIIFTTAFNQYAIDGYRVNALDYLLKPISYADFYGAVQKAAEWFKLTGQQSQVKSEPREEKIDSIYVKSEYKLLRIELDSILYVEGLKDYVKFHTSTSSKPILSLMNIKRAEEILPAEDFIRVHRSFIVRKDQIKIIERARIIFGSERIPIGDSYKGALQEYLKIRSI